MFQEITQQNLYLMIPHKIGEIASSICREKAWDYRKALLFIYHSRMYHLLEHEDSKLWHLSAEQLYCSMLKKELEKEA